MPRKLLIRTDEYPYHITNRSNNRENFYLDSQSLWEIYLDCLYQLNKQFGCKVHSFVLMSNHYHLIISTPLRNIGEAMKYFHREVAKKSNQKSKRINHFFGGRYKWSVIYQEDYYWNAIKYIFRNPVRAGICEKVQGHKYSSLNTHPLGWRWEMVDWFHHQQPYIQPDLDWLNDPFQNEVEESIRFGLRRREFKPPNTAQKKKSPLDQAQYKKGTVT